MGFLATKFSSIQRLRDMLMAEDRFYGKLLGSSLVGIFAIALIAAACLVVAIRDHGYETLRTRTLEVLRDANKVENDLANLETGHRGFLLTGQQAYLEPFERRRAAIQNRIDQLQAAFVGDAKQAPRVAQVKKNVEQWLTTVALPTIEERRRDPNAKLNPASGDVLGRSLIEDARKTLQALQDDKQIILNSKSRSHQSAGLSFQALVFVPKLESAIIEMEKSERGYLLTGDRVCLDNYRRAAAEFYAFQGHLNVLLADLPQQIEALGQIRANLERWQREAAAPEFAAKQENRDVAAVVAAGQGKAIMDSIRVQLSAFERSEMDIYEKARSRAELMRILKTAGFGVLCILAMGVLTASSWYSFVAYSRQLRKMESTEAQTRSIIETTLDGVVIISDQGLVHSMNPAAEKMFGVAAKDMSGESVTRIIPQRLFLQDMASLGRGTLTAMGHRQNFYPFPIEISLSDMKIEGKRHYVGLIRDVTERKRSEETLKHIGLGVSSSTGEEFVRSLIKQLSKALHSDFAFLVEITKRNDEDETNNACTLVIAENGHIRSKMNFKLANTACDEVLKKGFRAFPKGVRESFPKDDILRELNAESFVATQLSDHKGKTVGLMGVIDSKAMENVQIAESTLQIFAARAAAEIERKRFEEDLNAEKERLAVTLRSIGDGFIACDVEGRVVMINNVAERLTGWRQEQVITKPLVEIFNILNDRTRKPAQSMIERIIETGSVVGTANHALVVSREGLERLIEISAAPIRDKKNQRIGTVLVFRDITEKEHLEAERRKAEKLESLGVAAGGIAHDFNNLLTAIIGNLSLSLISVGPGDEMFERLTTAKKASLRAQELAQQLLTFAKGGAPIKKAASISQLIHDTVTFSLRGSNVRCDFWLPDTLWPVEIDSGQISQVINNLAINADQAMPSGGVLRVRCENFELVEETAALSPLLPGKYIKVSVQDEGIGIPEEYLKKIFDPYFTTKPKGSGLGLATSYSIVKNHEGLITVESKVGAGAAFSIYLPATDKEISLEKALKSDPEQGEGRILVLDDEEAICEILTCALEPCGYEVTTAQEALKAIRLYKEALDAGQRFDLVISDLTIPGGMGGAEAIKKLIEIDPTVKAIVSSGYANDPVMSRYKEYGFTACITKPYEIADMCHAVHEVITASKAGKNETMIYHDFAHAQLA